MQLNSLVSSARVVFLPENDHTQGKQRGEISHFLEEHYNFARGDIILVEDDEMKTGAQLNLEQLGEFAQSPSLAIGWDSHQSCLVRQEAARRFATHFQSIERLRQDRFSLVEEVDLRLLEIVAKQGQLSEWQGLTHASLAHTFQEPTQENMKQKLLDAMSNYLKNAQAYLALQHFPQRQINLSRKITACLSRNQHGIVYVLLGSEHLNVTDAKTSAAALNLLASLNAPYSIVHL